MKKNLIFVFLLIAQLCLAQDASSTTNSYLPEIEEFKRKGIPVFFFFKMYTPGATFISKNPSGCNTNRAEITYVFWKEDNIHWMKKMSPCGISNTIRVPHFKVVDFYLENKNKIETEKVRNYEVKKSERRNDTVYSYVISRTHTPLRVFEFHDNGKTSIKRIDKYKLTNTFKEENLNYKYNNSLSLVTLNHQCEKIISQLEEKKLLSEYLSID